MRAIRLVATLSLLSGCLTACQGPTPAAAKTEVGPGTARAPRVDAPAQGPRVATLAGASKGNADGTGGAAGFDGPGGLALAPDGTLYVADRFNRRIRKVTPAGVVTTVAGSTQGFADGKGAEAKFDFPWDLALAKDGTLYVSDNHRIRAIAPDGSVRTVAGSSEGFADGKADAARFSAPTGLALGPDGELYVADAANDRIRKVLPDGTVTTVAGSQRGFADGASGAARFNQPYAVAVAPDRALYVADSENDRLRVIAPDGKVSTLAGGAVGLQDGSGANAMFNKPRDLVRQADGTLYVSDTSNHVLRKVTPAGEVSTYAGSPGGDSGFAEGALLTARFNLPGGLALKDDGSLYVADYENHRIRVIR